MATNWDDVLARLSGQSTSTIDKSSPNKSITNTKEKTPKLSIPSLQFSTMNSFFNTKFSFEISSSDFYFKSTVIDLLIELEIPSLSKSIRSLFLTLRQLRCFSVLGSLHGESSSLAYTKAIQYLTSKRLKVKNLLKSFEVDFLQIQKLNKDIVSLMVPYVRKLNHLFEQFYSMTSSSSIEPTPSNKKRKEVHSPSSSSNKNIIYLSLISTLDSLYCELYVMSSLCRTPCPLPDPASYLYSLYGMHTPSSPSSSSPSEPPLLPPPISPSDLVPASLLSSNPLLAYLRLRRLESLLLSLPALLASSLLPSTSPSSSSTVPTFSLGFTPSPNPEDTMRGEEPLASDSIRDWWRSSRDRVAAWSSFACPSPHAIRALKTFCRERGSEVEPKSGDKSIKRGADSEREVELLEVGAGLGYWAWVLRKEGISVSAFDISPTPCSPPPYSSRGKEHKGTGGGGGGGRAVFNEYHGGFPSWSAVQKGETTTVLRRLHSHPFVLFLCYPPPNHPMASEALSLFRGSRLALVGEWSGDTGTKAFEAQLTRDWSLWRGERGVVPLPNFGNTCYQLTLWVRKTTPPSPSPSPDQSLYTSSPIKCVCCGSTPSPYSLTPSKGEKSRPRTSHPSLSTRWFRDRLTRAVFVCDRGLDESEESLPGSEVCASSREAERALLEALQERHLSLPGLPSPFQSVDRPESTTQKKSKKMNPLEPPVPSSSPPNLFSLIPFSQLWREVQ